MDNNYWDNGQNNGQGHNYYRYTASDLNNNTTPTNGGPDKKPKKEKPARTGNFGQFFVKVIIATVVVGVGSGLIFTAFAGKYLKNYIEQNVTVESNAAPSVAAAEESADTATTTEQQAGSLDTTNTDKATATAYDVSDIVDEVMPSVVAITNMSQTQIQDWFGQSHEYQEESMGSGVIIKEDSDYLYIATNNHVVQNATTITVNFVDDSAVTAEVKGTDSSSDLAVVAVKLADLDKKTKSAIKVATIGDSTALDVGDGAIAIGNALGYGQSVTTGVISALDREITIQDSTTGETITNRVIQTSAAINPGNSGGALLNMDGEVIAINSAKYADSAVEGMGFAIPMATANPILSNIIDREVVEGTDSAYLGINGVDVDAQVASAYNMPEGAYITSVEAGSSAEKAGLLYGDIITEFDGKKVSGMDSLKEQMQYYAAGEKVNITIQRAANGEYKEKNI